MMVREHNINYHNYTVSHNFVLFTLWLYLIISSQLENGDILIMHDIRQINHSELKHATGVSFLF